MTFDEHQALVRKTEWVKNHLGLKDWRIEVQTDPCEDDSQARIDNSYGRKVAYLYVASDWNEYDELRQLRTLIHEMLHCHFALAQSRIQNDIQAALGDEAWGIFWAAWLEAWEFGVDGIAEAIASYFPSMPPRESSGPLIGSIEREVIVADNGKR